LDFSWRFIYCLSKTRCLFRIELKNIIVIFLNFAVVLIHNISFFIIAWIARIWYNIVNFIRITSLDLQRREKRRIIKGLLLIHIFHHLFKFLDIVVRLIVHNFYDLCSLFLIDFLDLQIKICQYGATKSRQTSMKFYSNLAFKSKMIEYLKFLRFFFLLPMIRLQQLLSHIKMLLVKKIFIMP